MSTRNAPKWPLGTPEERRRNIDSHTWVLVDICKFFGMSGPVDPPEAIVCSVCGIMEPTGMYGDCANNIRPDWLNLRNSGALATGGSDEGSTQAVRP